jgi:hypothetical protein
MHRWTLAIAIDRPKVGAIRTARTTDRMTFLSGIAMRSLRGHTQTHAPSHFDHQHHHPHHAISSTKAYRLLDLLLGAELVGVTTLLLAAVGGTGRQTGVAFPADHLLAVVLGSQGLEGGLDDTATETEDQV